MASARTPLLADDDTSSLNSDSSALSTTSKVQNKQLERSRYVAFFSAILSCLFAGSITCYSLYGHLFQERLHYTQMEVNKVSIAAMLPMYLSVSILGWFCDRLGPAPMSFVSAILFAVGYLLAAFTYRSGASSISGYTYERGWPLEIMILAFVIIGLATTGMYLSAVTTCAKNFGKGRNRGLAMASPIAAFGLSGMWQSQFGEHVLYERTPEGGRGDVDVFKFFVFLAGSLFTVGLLGTFLLKVVDEEILIDAGIEELERSGLLEDSEFFQRANGSNRGIRERGYGSIDDQSEEAVAKAGEEARKKTWLLNEETRRFLKDHTMWWLAGGFFFVSGSLSSCSMRARS